MCSDPEDESPRCDGSFLQNTKVGNKMVRGSGNGTGKPKKPKGSNKVEADPWEYSISVREGFHVGPVADSFVPEHNSDDYNGFPRVYNRNSNDNFWLYFDLLYNEKSGITISNIMISNCATYPAFLNRVKFESGGVSVIPQFDYYGTSHELPSGFGSDFSFPSPPPFDGNSEVNILFEVGFTANVGQGPFQLYPDYNIVLPSLPDVMHFTEKANFLLFHLLCHKDTVLFQVKT
jgi:hypothetical protein